VLESFDPHSSTKLRRCPRALEDHDVMLVLRNKVLAPLPVFSFVGLDALVRQWPFLGGRFRI